MAKYFFSFFLSSVIFLLVPGSVSGQIELDSVTITDKAYLHHHLKPDYQLSDSTGLHSKDLLENIQSGQVQNSAPGGLVTFLHRGMGNRHLPVLWQGINIQSVVNGSYDLGLIPSSLIENMSFYTIGSPTLLGNNGFAGAIELNTSSYKKPGTQVYTTLSSLQNYAAGLNTVIQYKRFTLHAGAEMGLDKNIYTYNYNQQMLSRTATDFKKTNLILNGTYYISAQQSIKADVWWQDSNRNIPLSITVAPSEQRQIDKNLRISVAHDLHMKKHKLETALTYMNEKLNFFTPFIDSRSDLDVYALTLAWSEIKNRSYFIGFKMRKDIATPNFYLTTKSRLTTQLSVAKKIKWNDQLITNASIRQDVVDDSYMPLSWTVHTAFKKVALVMAANYNLPGFNDLYWPSGGNPDLKTEKSYQAEIKYEFNISDTQLKIATYSNLVKDWIQWVPQSNGIWTPANQKKVLSRGIEFNITKQYDFNKWRFTSMASLIYNRTTALQHYFDPTLVGKQLIYIPIHKAGIDLQVAKNNHSLMASYQYTGQRFDTSDESMFLKTIHILNLKYTFQHLKWKAQLSVNNMLNSDYNLVRFFPMPGINTEIKIVYAI